MLHARCPTAAQWIIYLSLLLHERLAYIIPERTDTHATREDGKGRRNFGEHAANKAEVLCTWLLYTTYVTDVVHMCIHMSCSSCADMVAICTQSSRTTPGEL